MQWVQGVVSGAASWHSWQPSLTRSLLGLLSNMLGCRCVCAQRRKTWPATEVWELSNKHYSNIVQPEKELKYLIGQTTGSFLCVAQSRLMSLGPPKANCIRNAFSGEHQDHSTFVNSLSFANRDSLTSLNLFMLRG